MTFIWLVLGGIGVTAVLLMVQEVRAFRGDARRFRHVIRTELLEIEEHLSAQESERIYLAAYEARTRLRAAPDTCANTANTTQSCDHARLQDAMEGADESALPLLPAKSKAETLQK